MEEIREVTVYTDASGRVYYSQNEDSTLTEHVIMGEWPEIPDKPLHNGYYTYDGVNIGYGYELSESKIQTEILELKTQLRKMDYLTHKELDGEDMSKYGDYKQERKRIRLKINEVESLLCE